MKYFSMFFFLLLTPISSFAQWQFAGAGDLSGNQPGSNYAFGVHDGTIFRSDVNGVWRHMDTGSHPWVETDNGIDKSKGGISFFASLGPFLFASQGYNRIIKTTNNGARWIPGNAAGPPASNGTFLFGSLGSSLAISTDTDSTWHRAIPPDPDFIASAGACILSSKDGRLYRSTDGGNNWATISPPSGLSLSAFAIIGTHIFAGGSGVFRSTDSGQNWSAVTSPPVGYILHQGPGSVNALVSYKTFLFAGTDTGVFVSRDSGGSWRNVSEGLGGGTYPGSLRLADVRVLALLDTLLYADVYTGTDFSGDATGYVARRPISEMTDTTQSVVAAAPQPRDTLAIYPNPATGVVTIFAGSTIIERVSVLSVLGVEVLTLDKPGGMSYNSEITLDLSQQPSGTYFLRIQTASGTVLRKVVREE